MKYSVGAIVTLGLAMVGSALAQQPAGSQDAVRWERAKDNAPVRHARLPLLPAARQVEETKSAGAATTAPKAGDGTVQDAVRWERAKDAAATRQAQVDAKRGSADTVAAVKTKKNK